MVQIQLDGFSFQFRENCAKRILAADAPLWILAQHFQCKSGTAWKVGLDMELGQHAANPCGFRIQTAIGVEQLAIVFVVDIDMSDETSQNKPQVPARTGDNSNARLNVPQVNFLGVTSIVRARFGSWSRTAFAISSVSVAALDVSCGSILWEFNSL